MIIIIHYITLPLSLSRFSSSLELMLGQIANSCLVISRNTIVKNSMCIDYICQTIRLHYGLQSNGARSRTLASIKPEISQALCSLVDELQSSKDARTMRSAVSNPPRQKLASLDRSRKSCPLCKEARRPDNHFLS